jgi:glycosyltransferase involved in cell wall biosynthesis
VWKVVISKQLPKKAAAPGRKRAAGAIVLEHLINRGQGAALKTGITYALRQGAEAVVTFDADGQHDPNEIAALLEPLEKNEVDIVLGSRFIKSGSNVPPLRRMALKAGILFTRVMSRINVTDTHNGFRAMNRVAAEKIKIVQDRMAHASEILDEIVYHKLRYKEVPVTITYSYYSKEKGQKTSALFKIAFKILAHKLTH